MDIMDTLSYIFLGGNVSNASQSIYPIFAFSHEYDCSSMLIALEKACSGFRIGDALLARDGKFIPAVGSTFKIQPSMDMVNSELWKAFLDEAETKLRDRSS